MAGTGIHPYHQQWPPAQAPPPPPPSAPGAPPPPVHHVPPPVLVDNSNRGPPTHDEVRTIFITGFPDDVKERELQNLLRWLPGYEASQVNYKGEKAMGFALFSCAQHAIAAKDALQDMVFDADTKSVLHTEMAKKNLFVKRGIVADSNAYDQSKRLRTGGDYSHTTYTSPSPFHPPPPVWGPHGYMTPAPPPYDPYGGYPVPQVPMPPPAPIPAPSSYVPVQNTKDNPPCNTLFIGNLGENINEDELRGLFSVQPGFKQMKVLRQERHTVCFIEFEDVNSATNVHHTLQGAVIPSSGSVGMRIQYPFRFVGFYILYTLPFLIFYLYILKLKHVFMSQTLHFNNVAVFLDFNLHIRRTHLGKGRMGSTMLLLLVPMEPHHQLPISSLKGMYSDLLLREIHDRMHLAAVACIHFIINIGISIPSHQVLHGSCFLDLCAFHILFISASILTFEEIVFWIISTEGNLRDVRVELENAMTRKLFQLNSDCAHSIIMPVLVLNFLSHP
ncbi:hypothetical protein NC651_025829 [Populus alba x Populus x berolinensis]|nr:hypothetical protein NC651_025829 [Populus alba x Populus x berolinensis]